MVEKIYIGDDTKTKTPDDDTPPKTLSELKQKVASMEIMADVDMVTKTKARVRVMDNVGTTMFMSKANDNLFYLSSFSESKEKKGSTTFFYFRLEG